ncbi:MAG: DUF6777 domain-containing protein [Actinomycetota bacterium]
MRVWFHGLRDRYGLGPFAVGAGVIVASIALVLVAVWPAQASSVEVYLERANSVGPDPFTDSLSFTDVTVPGELRSIAFGDGVTVVDGTAPGLYGGTGSDAECDPAQLIAFLAQEPDKAEAWAGVQGIEVDEIPAYISSLTPAVLMEDTWVTNHGYRDGRATPRQSILEAGTAVLVDDQGVPRARCKCGNPLTEPQVPDDLDRIEFVGEPWDDFDLNEVVRIEAAEVGDGLFLTRLPDGQALFRPLGTTGAADLLVADDGRFVQELDLEEALPETTPTGSGPFSLPLETSAGLPVEYEITGPCRWDGEELTLTGAGECSVLGTSPGDDTWSDVESEWLMLVEAQAQLIAAPEVGVLVVGEDPIPLEARADSGLPLSYLIEGPCEIAEDAIIGLEPGLCTITITQDGDDDWAEAEPVVIEIEVLGADEAGDREPQTINFSLPGSMRFGSNGVSLQATASSGLRVTFSVSGPCRISGSRLVPTGTGTCTVSAVQAGDADFERAVVSDRITVTAQTQTVDLSGLPSSIDIAGSVPLPATSSAGVTIVYSTSGPCSVAGNQLTVSGSGTCTLTGTAPATGNTASATSTRSIEIVEIVVDKQDQTITFPAPSGLTFGGPAVTMVATASSGLPPTYTVTAGPCTNDGASLAATGAGTCTVVASQPGDAEYNAAPSVSRTVDVARATPSVSVDAPDSLLVGETGTATGTSSAGLAVTLTGSGACTVSGTTVTATSEGTCTITGDQAGNGDYAPASGTAIVTVSKRIQTISFDAPTSMEVISRGENVVAIATSGLPVDLSASGTCRLAGNTVVPTDTGTCTVNGSQGGDGTWDAAPQASWTIDIVLAQQTIDWGVSGGTVELFSSVPMSAVASSGLPVVYTPTAPCVNDMPNVFFNGLGTCSITVSQAGNALYAPTSIRLDFTIIKRQQTIDFAQPPDFSQALSNGVTLSASATSGLAVTFVSQTPAVCELSGNFVFAAGQTGTCTIVASQAGNGTWDPAPNVSRSFQVLP